LVFTGSKKLLNLKFMNLFNSKNIKSLAR